MKNEDQHVMPIKPIVPVNNTGTYYQVEVINFLRSGGIKRIRLDSNYKYCTGVAIFTPFGGLSSDGIIGIKQKGNFIFDKVPMRHVFSDDVDNVDGAFLNADIKASGSLVEFYFESLSGFSSSYFYVIFRLENHKQISLNKKFDYNVIDLQPLVHTTGKFFFSYSRKIKKISFYQVAVPSSLNVTFSVRDSSRFYFKDMPLDFVKRLNSSDVNKRLFDCFAPTDNLMYDFYNQSGSFYKIFVVFEYED